MNEFLSLFGLIILCGASLVAFFAVLDLFFPKRIAKTQLAAETMPGRAFLVGIVNLVFFVAIGLALFILGNRTGVNFLVILGLIILVIPALGIIFGMAGIVRIVGERMAPGKGGWMSIAWGAVPLALACVLPVVGWFGLLPFIAIYGLGAFISGLFYRSQAGDDLMAERLVP